MSSGNSYECSCGARLGWTAPGFDRRKQLDRHVKTKRHRAYRAALVSPLQSEEAKADG